VGAMGLAVLAMILLERRDDRIWSAEDLDISGKVELLGSLPGGGTRARAAEHAALVCRSDPDSFFAEEVRNLAAGVLYPTGGKPVRTVLITSAAPGDGKTTLAVNLATCIANLGKRVLLIDANFRKPDVAGLFKLGNIPGLGDVLAYGSDLDEIVHTIDGLSVLTAGTPPPPGLHLLGSSAMKSILEQSGERHDYVIVDAPPLMLADARMLAPMVDGVVCSFRALASRRAAVEESLATLRRLGARTIGVALMGVNPKLNGFKGSAKTLSAYTRLKEPDGPPET
jgi:succinoglycan biosynthesis transport protein ExoP